jgi:hypothetical protein
MLEDGIVADFVSYFQNEHCFNWDHINHWEGNFKHYRNSNCVKVLCGFRTSLRASRGHSAVWRQKVGGHAFIAEPPPQ